MELEQLQQKCDEVVGMQSRIGHPSEDNMHLVYEASNGFELMRLNFVWSMNRWAFNGYAPPTSRMWSRFVEIARGEEDDK